MDTHTHTHCRDFAKIEQTGHSHWQYSDTLMLRYALKPRLWKQRKLGKCCTVLCCECVSDSRGGTCCRPRRGPSSVGLASWQQPGRPWGEQICFYERSRRGWSGYCLTCMAFLSFFSPAVRISLWDSSQPSEYQTLPCFPLVSTTASRFHCSQPETSAERVCLNIQC